MRGSNLQWILCAVQEFDISISRAIELIECDRSGKFTDMMPADVRSGRLFSLDDAPVLKYEELLAERNSLVAKLANKDENPTPDDDLDDDHPLSLVDSQINGLLQGQGASEDHEDVIAFFLKTGLPRSTVNRIHHAIVRGDMKTELRADIFRDMINELRDTAKIFYNHDSLRERLRGVVNKFIKVQL